MVPLPPPLPRAAAARARRARARPRPGAARPRRRLVRGGRGRGIRARARVCGGRHGPGGRHPRRDRLPALLLGARGDPRTLVQTVRTRGTAQPLSGGRPPRRPDPCPARARGASVELARRRGPRNPGPRFRAADRRAQGVAVPERRQADARRRRGCGGRPAETELLAPERAGRAGDCALLARPGRGGGRGALLRRGLRRRARLDRDAGRRPRRARAVGGQARRARAGGGARQRGA